MRRAVTNPWASRRQRMGLALLGLLLLSTSACGGNQLSATGDMCCGEINFFTLRTEARVSAVQAELVWHLMARPREFRGLWKTDQWPKLSVAVVVPLSSGGNGDLLDRSCFGRGLLKLPSFDEVLPLVVRQRFLAVERRGGEVTAGGGVMLEFVIDSGQSPRVSPIRSPIDLYLEPISAEVSETLSPQGAEILAQIPATCAQVDP